MQILINQLFRLIIINLIFGFASVVYAEGMQLKPGLWEIKTVVTLPLNGGNQESTSQDCLSESKITPEDMINDDQDCLISNANVNANSMQWTMTCQNQGIEMIGEGNAESSGKKITGGMNISATFNGQEMTMSTNWQGKYIGDCN